MERMIQARDLRVRDVILGPESEWPVHDLTPPGASVIEAQLGFEDHREWWSWKPSEQLLIRRA